ncbi:MAG: hypothetical protein HOH33_02130 [Verrucomicrobia bacterium]|jgi:tetratricopeptide (TPR) repeat protein|nr:hypothetical protein [Verrucomicrobiota bacterium]
MPHRVIISVCLLLALMACGLGGCASSPARYRPPWTGNPIADGLHAVTNAPAKDRVLWQMITAKSALFQKKYDLAKNLLDDALLSIENRYGKDKEARKSRKLFQDESDKFFLGEPYERVMAYYYRGILYWMEGQPDNARACFRSAQLQDSDSENNDYRNDYVLMDYLDGLASLKLRASADSNYMRATNVARIAIPPPYQPADNVLVFADYGKGPTKYASGAYGEQLRFKEGRSSALEIKITSGNALLHLGPYDDLSFQANTRGGRVMDHVLANQAVFKSTTDAAGDVALMSGMVLAHGRNTQEVGLGLVAAGLVSKMFSAAATPDADTRDWDNLPQYLTFGTLSLPPGNHVMTLEYLDDSGSVIPSLTRTENIQVNPAPKDTVLYFSDTKD